ncbi:MAG: alpha/beta fold hydrolase [Candidatus Komeilibacteria bacterium]|nr:alpha/beta fold hydrolase [Candidatus Komeilibacteria bacterium]
MKDDDGHLSGSFYFPAPGSQAVVILVHGLTGGPNDMRPLAEFLQAQGLNVFGVKLAGCGVSWEALSHIYYYQLWESVEAPLKNYLAQNKNIFLIGYSFGGDLALELAYKYQHHRQLRGVITLGLSVFFKYDWFFRCLVFGLEKIKGSRFYSWLDQIMRSWAIKRPVGIIPFSTFSQVYKFIDRYTKKAIPQFRPGALLIHSLADELSQAYGSMYVYERLRSKDKELFLLEGTDHLAANQGNRQIVFAKILEFIQKRLKDNK